MVAIPTGLAINTPTPGDRTTAAGFRKILAFLFAQSSPGTPTPGVLYAGASATPLDVLPSASTMTYTVKAGMAVTARAGQGAYLVGSVIDVTVSTAAADGTNPRWDRVYIVQPDPELSEVGVARIDVVNGTPGASPTLPALPTGALELGRKLIGPGVTNTNDGTAISDKAARTVLGAGINWADVLNKPSTFTPAAHTHTVADITDLATNGNVAKVDGKRIKVATSQPATPGGGWTVGDVWIDY